MKVYKLGRRPVRHTLKRLHLAKYINRSTIKLSDTVPLDLSYHPARIGMLANGPDPLNPPEIPDGVGCCAWAAAVRAAFMRRMSTGSVPVHVTLDQPWAVESVLEGYATTGFDIKNPGATDHGTDPDALFAWLQDTGVRMWDGTMDRIEGVTVAVNPRDLEEVYIAHRLFGGLYVGFLFPAQWEEADVWGEVVNPDIQGGHEVVAMSDVSVTPEGLRGDSWGMVKVFTAAGLAQLCDQLTAVVDTGFFGAGGKAINGFDAEQLEADADSM